MQIFTFPLLISLVAAGVVLFVANIFAKQKIVNIIINALYVVDITLFTIFGLLYGASFQEVLIVVLFFLAAYLFFFFGFRDKTEIKEEEKK